jgi:hypothetical protein
MSIIKDLAGLGLSDIVAGVFRPAMELIDAMHTSEEERLESKANLLNAQAAAMDKVLQYEKESLVARARIVEAEAKSEHVITATWRPLVMITMTGLAVGDALGLLPNPLAPEAWLLLQVGLGGYVVGRSGEKIVKTIKRG